jgi:DNA invertase Pin-like site-specific DNA recombinase
MAREDFGTMRIGYARVSTTDQKPELQIDALLKAGVERRHLYEDHMTGLRADRPKRKRHLLTTLRGGSSRATMAGWFPERELDQAA